MGEQRDGGTVSDQVEQPVPHDAAPGEDVSSSELTGHEAVDGVLRSLDGLGDKPVEERVKAIIVEQLGVEENDVAPAAKFIEDLGADSLDTVELVMAFEEEFDIEIPDEDAEKITTVGDAIQYIKENT